MIKTAAHKYADEFLRATGRSVQTSWIGPHAFICEEYVIYLEMRLAASLETIARQAEDLRFITEARR
jgi:hypothetical protein